MENRLFKIHMAARVLFFLAAMLGVSLSMVPCRLEFVRTEASGQLPEIGRAPAPERTVLIAEVTAYTSRPEETDDTPEITASGETVYDGGIACPTRFKFGTKIEIAGKVYTCNDRMNRRYAHTNHFDIWYPDKSSALRFGRQKLTVLVLDGEKKNQVSVLSDAD